MKKLKSEEAITILKYMMVDIPVPKAAVTQIKRNEAIEMAINALKCSGILNSSDTISRQAAIDAVEFGITYAKAINKSTGEVKELFKEGNKALNEAVERLKELPSAQPEIIRCKDCKHHHYEGEDIPYCDRIDYGYGWKDNDYCSMAERRTDERFDINTRSSC